MNNNSISPIGYIRQLEELIVKWKEFISTRDNFLKKQSNHLFISSEEELTEMCYLLTVSAKTLGAIEMFLMNDDIKPEIEDRLNSKRKYILHNIEKTLGRTLPKSG